MTIDQQAQAVEGPEQPAQTGDVAETPGDVAGEADSAERADEQAPTPQAKDPDADLDRKRFAALARQQRLLRSRQRELAEAADVRRRYDEQVRRLRDDPLGALSEHGITYEELTRRVLDAQVGTAQAAETPESKRLRELEERLKRREEADQEALQRQQQQQMQQLVRAHLDEQYRYCSERAEHYEMIVADPATAGQIYLDLYRQLSQIEQRDLEPDETHALLDRTEKLLAERADETFARLAKTKRFSARLAQSPPVTTEQTVTDRAPQQRQPRVVEQRRTLASDLPSTPRPTTEATGPEERVRRKLDEIARKYDQQK